MTMRLSRRTFTWASVAAVLAARQACASANPSREVAVGERLADVELRGLNGPSRRLGQYFGRPLIINVWASWCGPCREETASLERLAWREGSGRFTVIGISTDDRIDDAQGWLRRSNATISHFIDQHLQLETLLGASRLPLTVLVGADARVLARVYGSRDWDSAPQRAFIASVFASRPGHHEP